MLEQSPIPSTNEEPVLFDTAEIPWWAWIRRFHLPEVRPPFLRKTRLSEIPLARKVATPCGSWSLCECTVEALKVRFWTTGVVVLAGVARHMGAVVLRAAEMLAAPADQPVH